VFGPYPFAAYGVLAVDEPLGFALETQTLTIVGSDTARAGAAAEELLVHELAHQWVGNSVSPSTWKDIWLNEGFATYAEWLWSEDQGLDTTQEIFDFWATVFPPEEGFWQVTIGDPGPDALFDFAVYIRGAMTLHTLRGTVGDAVFFEILESWATSRRDSNVTTSEFIELAEDASGQELDELFERWLSTPGYPLDAVPSAAARRAPTARDRPVVLVAERLERLGGAHRAP
jgi:aminopeptidase N